MGSKRRIILSMVLIVTMLLSNSMVAFATEDAAVQSVGSTQTVTDSTDSSTAETAAVAQIGDVTYNNITEALKAASENENDKTVTMLSSPTETVPVVAINSGVTLDLNGQALSADYVTCFGNITDSSNDNGGVLKVEDRHFLIQRSNASLPVKTTDGYKFVDVEFEEDKTYYDEDNAKYSFEPTIEAAGHDLIEAGAGTSGVTIGVHVAWQQGGENRSQDFIYKDAYVKDFLDSLDTENKKMFTLKLINAADIDTLTFNAFAKSAKGTAVESAPTTVNNGGDSGSGSVTTDENNKVTESVTIKNQQGTADVAAGTQLDENTTALTLTVDKMDETTSDIELAASEEILAVDVHVDGVAAGNTVPIIITLPEFAPEYMNQGNISLYHVENGKTVAMTRVYSIAAVDAHNEFYYDVTTGTVTMALATFSEIAVVSDTENAWGGNYDYSWYTNVAALADGESDADYVIANADQLAAFGAIVGGMNGQTQDSFAGKTIKLLADVNLGDAEANNDANKIFYPIGYYNSTGSYARTTDSITSNVSSFKGTFDGNGHTISNFYQNTWEMFGDYNDGYSEGSNYYKDAMGLFGYVNGGTVKNLTVDNFSSDGEFTPTGVVAAYAVNSTFENIAITNCNPRVYNTGNGGIVGIGGNSDDPDTYNLTFTNITIDNTNKITALWGSWDVACGGLVGMFRGAGHAYMTNCHVAAQIDVYNDVCGNYQYYWYRYAGMMIGTNKNMVTDANGYTVPETTKFHAEECTVHFGDWNNYYYCELVANSLASYTHDHQFSRLTEVDSVDVENMTITVDGETTAIPTSGRVNYVVVKGQANTQNATCYHFVNGEVWNHEDAGKETVDGVEVLKEDKQHVYLPFNQLFTGYGWGVKHIPIYDNAEENVFDGITILGRDEAKSIKKFAAKVEENSTYTTGTEVKVGDLFEAIEQFEEPIKAKNVQVTVSPVSTESSPSTAGGAFTPAEKDADGNVDWTQGTLTFSGEGAAQIIITDYNYCEKTTLNVIIKAPEKIEKFDAINETTVIDLADENTAGTITLGELFAAKEGIEIEDTSVTIEAPDGVTYKANTDAWSEGTLTFTVVDEYEIGITAGDYCLPTKATVKVVKSVEKFEAKAESVEIDLADENTAGTITLGDLFEAIEGLEIEEVNVTVPDGVTYTPKSDAWAKGTLTFAGVGEYEIGITAGDYCLPTTATVNVVQSVEKFNIVFPNVKEYMYRVGNQNTVALGSLFEAAEGVEIGTVDVKVEAVEGTSASGTYEANNTWTSGTIKFERTGVVKVTITDNEYCIPTVLYLEVVDAKNAIVATSAKSNNVVLLNDCNMSTIEVSGGYTLYGNGFKMTATNDVRYYAMNAGFVVLNNGTLDNVQIICPNFSHSIIYNTNMTEAANQHSYDSNSESYGNVRSAVMADGNSTIMNSYIHGGRAAVFVRSGNVVIDNSTISGGAAANIHAISAKSLTLRDITMIQKPFQATVHNTDKTLMGFSGLFECDENGESTPLILEGSLIQDAWIDESHSIYVPTNASQLIENALKKNQYMHDLDGDSINESLNLGFTYIPQNAGGATNVDVTDNRDNKAFVPYSSVEVKDLIGSARVYSYENTKGTSDDFILDGDSTYIPNSQGAIAPVVKFADTNEDRVFSTTFNSDDGRWESSLTVNLDNGNYDFSFEKLDVKKYGKKLNYTVKMEDGTEVDSSKDISLSSAGVTTYELYAEDGDATHIMYFILTATKSSIPEPEVADTTGGTPLLVVKAKNDDWSCAIPALDGIKIKYYTSANDSVTLDLAELTPTSTGKQNGTNNYWEYSNGYSLKVTCGYIHDTKQIYGMPVVVNNGGNKMYFTISSTNGYVSTGTASRTVTITYDFTDPNGKTLTFNKTWQFNYADYKNGTQYSYSEFVKGTLKEASSGCVTPDTLVNLADGSQKRIDELNFADKILAWDFFTGTYCEQPISILINHGEDKYRVANLEFSDGIQLKLIAEHGVFDYDLNKYVYISVDNMNDYINHRFVQYAEDGSYSIVTLEEAYETEEYTSAWSVSSATTSNAFASGILTVAPPDDFYNWIEMGDKLMYDVEQFNEDVEKYGLYTYEDFKDYVTYEQFVAFNGAYLKIPVEKGQFTFDYILELIELYADYMPE